MFRPKLYCAATQTEGDHLKSKDELIKRIDQLTDREECLIDKIQELTLHLEKAQETIQTLNTKVESDLLRNGSDAETNSRQCDSCTTLLEKNAIMDEIINELKIANYKLNIDNDTLKKQLEDRTEAQDTSIAKHMSAGTSNLSEPELPLPNKITSNSSKPLSQQKIFQKGKSRRRVTIYSDSHGRYLSQMIVNHINPNTYKVLVECKPGAETPTITPNITTQTYTIQDTVVLLGGTNDVASGNENQVYKTYLEVIANLTVPQILIVAVPHRYDLPIDHPTNDKIFLVNWLLKSLTHKSARVKFVDATVIERRCFSSHGLHLNLKGKNRLALLIAEKLTHWESSKRDDDLAHMRTTIQETRPDFCYADKDSNGEGEAVERGAPTALQGLLTETLDKEGDDSVEEVASVQFFVQVDETSGARSCLSESTHEDLTAIQSHPEQVQLHTIKQDLNDVKQSFLEMDPEKMDIK